jgi:trk system potassium uptake protein TrkA
VAHGDARASKLVGRRVEQIKLPPGARLGAIVRGQGEACEMLMPHHDTLIESGDHVIIFMAHKRMLREVEKLFQVSATFL